MENVDSPDVVKTLENLLKIIPKLTFIKKINRLFQYFDEPQFYQYSSDIYIDPLDSDGVIKEKWKAGGSSIFSEKLAFLKCLGESIERYSCMHYKNSDFIFDTYQHLNLKAVNPSRFSKFSKKQKSQPHFRTFNYNEKTPFAWIKAKSLFEDAEWLVPAQLVYFNYKLTTENERLIDIPISTGAAFSNTFKSALLYGLFELVERDSFAIMYMNRITCPKVDLTAIDDDRIKHLLEIALQYRLEINMIDITTDLGIPTFAAVVINRTGTGPAVQTGIKTHLNPIEAMLGAFHESLQTRCWMRRIYENERSKYSHIHPNEIDSFEKRGVFWYQKKMIKYLNFWINQPVTPLNKAYQIHWNSTHEMLRQLKRTFKQNNIYAYYVDLTIPSLVKSGCKVVKVISPDLQPHFFNEKYKLLGGDRLLNVPKKLGFNQTMPFNKIPHPFL